MSGVLWGGRLRACMHACCSTLWRQPAGKHGGQIVTCTARPFPAPPRHNSPLAPRAPQVTALYLAVQQAHNEIVELLLAAGANPTKRAVTDDGQSFSPEDIAMNNVRAACPTHHTSSCHCHCRTATGGLAIAVHGDMGIGSSRCMTRRCARTQCTVFGSPWCCVQACLASARMAPWVAALPSADACALIPACVRAAAAEDVVAPAARAP